MIVLEGRVPTRVPTPAHAGTRVPERPHTRTPVPACRVATPVPEVVHRSTRVPTPPRIRTRRPPTQTRLLATSTAEVTATADIYAHLALPFAEQSIQVDKVAAIAVNVPAEQSAEVTATADLRVRYRVLAESSAEVSAEALARIRHNLDAVQDIATSSAGEGVRARYNLEAVQDIAVDHSIDTRPRLELDAAQNVATTSVASLVPSVGTVDADAEQSFEVTATADLRVRYRVQAVQNITVTEEMTRDAIRIPLEATQSIAVDQTATPRARYSLDALQAAAVAQTAKMTPVIAATSSAAVDSTATARARHTVDATSSAATSSTATAAVVTFPRQRVDKSGSFANNGNNQIVTGWVPNATNPGTVGSNRLVVQSSASNVIVRAVLNLQPGSGFYPMSWRLYLNGVQIGTAMTGITASGLSSITVTGLTLAAGDAIEAQVSKDGFGPNNTVLAAGTYLEASLV